MKHSVHYNHFGEFFYINMPSLNSDSFMFFCFCFFLNYSINFTYVLINISTSSYMISNLKECNKQIITFLYI